MGRALRCENAFIYKWKTMAYVYILATVLSVVGVSASDVILSTEGENRWSQVHKYHGVYQESHVCPVTADFLTDSPGWSVEGNKSGSQFGFSLCTAGDVNGDGIDDVLVGAFGYNSYDENAQGGGKVFLYYGSNSGLSQSADWTIESDMAGDSFGYSLSTAGDVNGDGFSDIIIGAPTYKINEMNQVGKVFVYYGSETGPGDHADWIMNGEQKSGAFGRSVSTAGDINGDGYSDVVIGCPSSIYNGSVSHCGAVYGFYGSENGLPDTASWKVALENEEAAFGFSVSTAGDVNGDGFDDVIAGARFYSNQYSQEGAAYVYYGSSTGLERIESWMIEGGQEFARLGNSVSTAGDVNGDGYGDVIIGAYMFDNIWHGSGNVYAYYGSESGLSQTADWVQGGSQNDEQFGFDVSMVGDINKDGFSDIVIGSPYMNGLSTHSGAVFIYLGSRTGLFNEASWQMKSAYLGSLFGTSVSPAGDVNNDGFDDLMVGANMYSNELSNEGAAFVFYGYFDDLSAWVMR